MYPLPVMQPSPGWKISPTPPRLLRPLTRYQEKMGSRVIEENVKSSLDGILVKSSLDGIYVNM